MPENLTTVVTSRTKEVLISRDRPCVIIGERINPTGRKKLAASLQEGNFDIVRRDAVAQVEAGAKILDVNVGVPGADEPALLVQALQAVREVTDVPLCIDTADEVALEAGLKVYDGKALINSVNGEEARLESVLPLVKEYGAAVIGLCMDDDGIPPTAEGRFAVAGKIIERAGITLVRIHGSADEICIFDVFASLLGLGDPVCGEKCRKVYEIEPVPFRQLVERVKRAVGMDHVR